MGSVMPLGVSSVERPGQLDPGGPAADDIATLWWGLLAAGTVIALLVAVLLVLPMVRRRRRMPDVSADHDDVPQQLANRWIIGLGVVMPGVILIAVLVFSVSTMRTVSRAAPAGSVVIDVVSYQFWWAASYPADDPDDDVIVANEIHIPVGEPVELRLTSADVIHSFWAPELQGKLDMLPDGTNTLVIEADEPGEYLGACAEFCGVQHALMRFVVIAEPPDEFAAWLSAQRSPASDATADAAQRGQALFAAEDCGACHTVRGAPEAGAATMPGPDLTHVASRSTLAAATIPNTPVELARWLRDPDAVKPGTTMPAPELTADEIDDLVAYLDSLR